MSHFNFSEIESRLNELGEELTDLVGRVVSKKERPTGFRPTLDAVKDDEQITLLIDLPGMDKSDVVISQRNQVLSISGTRKPEDAPDAGFLKRERSSGAFNRSFALPAGVNSADIKASFSKGVLRVTVPLQDKANESETIIIE